MQMQVGALSTTMSSYNQKDALLFSELGGLMLQTCTCMSTGCHPPPGKCLVQVRSLNSICQAQAGVLHQGQALHCSIQASADGSHQAGQLLSRPFSLHTQPIESVTTQVGYLLLSSTCNDETALSACMLAESKVTSHRSATCYLPSMCNVETAHSRRLPSQQAARVYCHLGNVVRKAICTQLVTRRQ